jgi:hypothetical protein
MFACGAAAGKFKSDSHRLFVILLGHSERRSADKISAFQVDGE